METDSLFYRLFEEKPKLLFELLGEKPPRTTYSFGAHELKQTSLRTDGGSFPGDGCPAIDGHEG
jgi:predicted transposase YdaD